MPSSRTRRVACSPSWTDSNGGLPPPFSLVFAFMLHPTVRLVLWGAAVASTQLLPLYGLTALGGMILPAAALLSKVRFFLLLKRARWLLLSIAILFALATPGVLLMPELASLGPTREGITLGLTQLMRLVLVLAMLAVLLQFTPLDDLVSGLYGLLRPLAWLGLDRGRAALRLLLVLRYVESAPPAANWREWLEREDSPVDAGPVMLHSAPLTTADYVVLACLGVGTALAAWP